MKPPRDASQYRDDILRYGERSYTKTIFQGYVYRFLVELLRHDETDLSKEWPDLDDYALAHVSQFSVDTHIPGHLSSKYKYSQLQDLLRVALPSKGGGQVVFLGGHLSGSWLAALGARYEIAPEFFRHHIHLWRSSQGPVLHAVPNLPSTSVQTGIALRINTVAGSVRPLGKKSLALRRKLLPERFYHNPTISLLAPGSTYTRGHTYLDDALILIEQDISITVKPCGDGWTAIVWSDVGSKDLSHCEDFRRFIDRLTAGSKSGLQSIHLHPLAILGYDSELRHPLPTLAQECNANPVNDDSLVQPASHLPFEFHLALDHSIAAMDPLYALSPIFRFAATTSNQALNDIAQRYEIISSTNWDPRDYKDFLEQLILHKHLLDDNACRHEEVLRYLRSPHLTKWAMKLNTQQTEVADAAKRAVELDYEYLTRRCRDYSEHHHAAITILTSLTALRESNQQFKLATQVTKLTILATIFLPLSFCTSIFGMNFIELENLSIWIGAVVTVCIGIITFVVYQWDDRDRVIEPLAQKWAQHRKKSRKGAHSTTFDTSIP